MVFKVTETPGSFDGQVPMNAEIKAVTAPSVLAAARQHMLDRAATYDKPEGERSMAQTVAIFNQFHGTKLTEAQGWHFMQVLKDVRLFTRPAYHADSAEDGVAYAALKAEAKAAESRCADTGAFSVVQNFGGVPDHSNEMLMRKGLNPFPNAT